MAEPLRQLVGGCCQAEVVKVLRVVEALGRGWEMAGVVVVT